MFWFKKKEEKRQTNQAKSKFSYSPSNRRKVLSKAHLTKLCSFIRSNKDHFNQTGQDFNDIAQKFTEISGIEVTQWNVRNMVYRKKIKVGAAYCPPTIPSLEKPKRKKLTQQQYEQKVRALEKGRARLKEINLEKSKAKHAIKKTTDVAENNIFLNLTKKKIVDISDIRLISLIILPILEIIENEAKITGDTSYDTHISKIRYRTNELVKRGIERDKSGKSK